MYKVKLTAAGKKLILDTLTDEDERGSRAIRDLEGSYFEDDFDVLHLPYLDLVSVAHPFPAREEFIPYIELHKGKHFTREPRRFGVKHFTWKKVVKAPVVAKP